MVFYWYLVSLLIVVILVLITYRSIVIIQPHEQGLKIFMGKYVGKVNPGLNFVPPMITRVVRIDLRTQVFDVPRQEVLFRDKEKGVVNAIFYIKVVDVERAFFEVADYRLASVALAQTTLRNAVSEISFEELLNNRELIGKEICEKMADDLKAWGVIAEKFEFYDLSEE